MTSRIHNRIRLSEDNVGRDRLSELPDEIIVHILSRMPTVDAVRTVLLHRFGNLWTLIHTLDFDMGEYLNNFNPCQDRGKHIQWFYRFVSIVLILHQNLSIDRFHLCIDTDFKSYKSERTDLDKLIWSRFALCRQAKEISISNKYKYGFCCSSILPNFASQSLVTLELGFCKFEGKIQIELGSLKKLSLNRVWMTDENFQRFISGCPSLQELVITNPLKMKELRQWVNPRFLYFSKFENLSLKTKTWQNPVLLYFSNIENLSLKTKTWQLDIVDVSSVCNIYIRNSELMNTNNDLVLTINQVLERKFEGIEVSRLSCDASKEFLHSIKKLQLLQCTWTRVVLELQDFCQNCVLGLYHLIRSLKHLEELIIYTTEDFKASGDLPYMYRPSRFVKQPLKTITLHGYRKSWKSLLQLVKFLFESAPSLDELVIVPVNHKLKKEEELELVKHISNFPKASPSVRITFA